MSDEERRRIGDRGSGFSQDKGEITDKGAKDFKEGMSSIATTSKLGGFALLADMFTKITDLGNNPILNTLLNFFQLFGTFLNAAGAEQAQILAEALFKEENVQIMKDLAEATQDATISVEDLTRSITVWTTVFDTIAPGFKLLEDTLKPFREEIEWLNDNIPRQLFKLEHLMVNYLIFLISLVALASLVVVEAVGAGVAVMMILGGILLIEVIKKWLP